MKKKALFLFLLLTFCLAWAISANEVKPDNLRMDFNREAYCTNDGQWVDCPVAGSDCAYF